VRRSIADPADLAYFVVLAPARSWRGWHRHVTLAMLALACSPGCGPA
jgi:SRSO17 transposase